MVLGDVEQDPPLYLTTKHDNKRPLEQELLGYSLASSPSQNGKG
jgi:hypothetical protein